jgi:sigma-B regulation protein RsbU (phosphoserine phosphatase)
LFFGVLDPAKGTFAYASAGHDPPLFFHASTAQITGIESTGLVIGVAEGESYHSGSVKLAPRDTLMLYTDGITDARNGGPRLGYECMLKVFKGNTRQDGGLIADAVLDAARRAAGDRWPDDAAVLVVKAGEAWVAA